MKDMIFQWLKDWIMDKLRSWLPLFLLSLVAVAVANGQDKGRQNPDSATRSSAFKPISPANSELLTADWTEYDIQSLNFHLPDYWHVFESQEVDLKARFEEAADLNPQLNRLKPYMNAVKDVDVFAINTRNSIERYTELMVVKKTSLGPLERTDSETLAGMVADHLQDSAVISQYSKGSVQVKGRNVAFVRYLVPFESPTGVRLEIETVQFVFVCFGKVALVNFSYESRNATERRPEIEAIVKAFEF